MRNPRLMTIIGLIFAAAASRLIPHPPNMTSITAVALFGGAYFSDV
jgi:ABC-type amino acid transport system permease subunit